MTDIQELVMTRSVLALVNGEPWDMHKPLTDDCELRFLHFKDDDPSLSNKVDTFLYVYFILYSVNCYKLCSNCITVIRPCVCGIT